MIETDYRDCLLSSQVRTGQTFENPGCFSRQPLRPHPRLVRIFQILTNNGKALEFLEKYSHTRSLGYSDRPSGLHPSGQSEYPWDLIREFFPDNPVDFLLFVPEQQCSSCNSLLKEV